MELIKKNINTEKIKSKALLQMPMEEDINISDTKPDVSQIIYSAGDVRIEEIKVGMNKIWVKGQLCYQILYQTDASEHNQENASQKMEYANMEGGIPFMEEIYLDKIEGQDRIICSTVLEDMRVHIINSRKFSIQAVVSFEPRIEEISIDEVCTDLGDVADGAESNRFEYRKKNMDYLETFIKKRDLLRIHEEAKLPIGMPQIGKLLWKSMDISNVSFKALDNNLMFSGEINLFIIYEEESKSANNGESNMNWYEVNLPFSGNIECQNARESMIADVQYVIGHEDIGVRDDADGEARIISVESTLELEIKLCKKENTSIVADVYGVSCDVQTFTQEKEFKNLLADLAVEEKINKNIMIESNEPKILQICHSNAKVEVEDVVFVDDAIKISGNIIYGALYTSGDVVNGFFPIKESIPFEVIRPVNEAVGKEIDQYSLNAQVSQPIVSIKDGSQIEVRMTLSVSLLVYETTKEEILTDIKIEPINPQILEKLPGFVIYFVNKGDSLWQIGKKYYVSVDRIKEINNLTSDEIRPGDRLLIVK